ncbi:hypothetical protein ACWGIB_17885 [Streptomyces xiamenensis]
MDARLNLFGNQLATLVSLIAVISAYNPRNVLVRRPADCYTPGQFG